VARGRFRDDRSGNRHPGYDAWPVRQSGPRVVSFNTVEGWSSDVSADVAQEVRRRCDLQLREVPANIQEFVSRHEGSDRVG